MAYNDGLVEIKNGKKTARVRPESVATWVNKGWSVDNKATSEGALQVVKDLDPKKTTK